jgi:hypothetical protein
MGKFAELAARYLPTLFEAERAGLTRNEWLSLNGFDAGEWHQVSWYLKTHCIHYPMLKGMRRPHRRRWLRKPAAIRAAARKAPPIRIAPPPRAETFEIRVSA